jgi:hypothetical protein
MPSPEEIAAAAEAKKEFFKNPVLFAQKAVMIPGYLDMTVRQNGGVGTMALVRDENYTARRFHGEEIPVYMISDGRQFGDGGFKAYWCPYDQNSVKQTTVWNGADAMFTDRMDGCTFAFGAPSEDGAVLVCHVNQNQYDQPGDTSKTERVQRRMALLTVGWGGGILEPKGYRRKPGEDVGLESTTFGVRDTRTGKWSFYAQAIERDFTQVTLRTIKKIG